MFGIERRRALRLGVALVASVAVAGVAVGCGDDDDGDSSATTTSQQAKKVAFTGDPVTIYTIAPVKTPAADVPGIPSAVRAAAAAMNERGGLAGHEIQVKFCNDTDANAEITCARQAQRNKALAFAGSAWVYNGTAAEKMLDKADIADVATMLNPSQYSSPAAYSIDTPSFGYYACAPLTQKLLGKKPIGMVSQNLPIQVATVKAIKAQTKLAGDKYVGATVLPVSTTDYAPAVQQLSNKGAEIVVSQLIPPSVPSFLGSAQSLGKKFAFCTTDAVVPVDILGKLGPAGENVYLGGTLPSLSEADKYPLMKRFQAEMKAAQDGGDENAALDKGIPTHALRAWLGVQIIEQAAKAVDGPLNNVTLRAAVEKLKPDVDGMVPPIDWSKPSAAKGFERIFNPTVRLLKWDPSKKETVETSAGTLNALEAIAPR